MLAIYVKPSPNKPKAKLTFRLSLTIYSLWAILGGSIITFVSLLYTGVNSSFVQQMNFVFGIIGTVTIIFQWSPQIVTTFVHKGPGALSILTLAISAPGSILTFISLLFARKSASVWLPYILSATQQIIIISMALFFRFRKKQNLGYEILDQESTQFIGPVPIVRDELIIKSSKKGYSDSEISLISYHNSSSSHSPLLKHRLEFNEDLKLEFNENYKLKRFNSSPLLPNYLSEDFVDNSPIN